MRALSKSSSLLLLAPLALVFSLGCSSESAADSDEDTGALETHAAPHWSYSDAEHWGDIADSWKACKEGQRQSPIDITSSTAKTDTTLGALRFEYTSLPLHVLNNGHTVQANGAPNANAPAPTLRVNGKTYSLAQLHFHAGSEHMFDGHRSPLELHLVHKNVADANDLAVVGITFEEGAENETLRDILANAPRQKSEEKRVEGATIDLRELVSADAPYVTYPGSLTTPPCSETVTWYVMTKPLSVSKAQLGAYEAAVPGPSYRPVQRLNGRVPRQFAATSR